MTRLSWCTDQPALLWWLQMSRYLAPGHQQSSCWFDRDYSITCIIFRNILSTPVCIHYSCAGPTIPMPRSLEHWILASSGQRRSLPHHDHALTHWPLWYTSVILKYNLAIFKPISTIKDRCRAFPIALRWMSQDLTDEKSKLVRNSLVPSGNKPLLGPMFTQFYLAMWCHQFTMT